MSIADDLTAEAAKVTANGYKLNAETMHRLKQLLLDAADLIERLEVEVIQWRQAHSRSVEDARTYLERYEQAMADLEVLG